LTTEGLERAASVIGSAGNVALACHVNPDADALGSMLALSVTLRRRGIETTCSFGNDPFELPRWISLLPGREALVPPGEFPAEPDLMVTCDTASLDRLGSLAASAERAKELVWIDHHVSNDGLGTIPVIDPTASSTSELVFRLVGAMGVPLSDEAAVCLYAGLVTDTGRFQYQAVRPETLELGAALRRHPFDHALLVRALYEDNRTAYLRLLGTALSRIELDEGSDVVWTHLLRSDLDAAGVHPAEADDLIDVVRTARETDVAAVVKEQQDGRFKVSMRSRGKHDVAAVAQLFGGGGHRLAAGYTSSHDLSETLERMKAALRGDTVEP
jgi:phosphoesterase RecJ-like protein